MEEKNCEFFMKQLNLVLFKNQSLDSIRDIINPNYVDYNGNNIFHYFSEFSLKKYEDLTYDSNKRLLLPEIDYKIKLNEYKFLIPLYIKYLDELKCDMLSKNKYNQSPLIYSVVQKNYCITKQYLIYLRNMNLLTNDILYDTFNHAINNGDCLRNDCIDLILYILSLAKEKNIRLYDNSSLKGEEKLHYDCPVISLCKDYSKCVTAKFYENIKMKISTSIMKKNFDLFNQREIEIISKEIIKDAKLYLFKFINEVFLPLLNFFISNLNKDISNNKIFNSIFIYLMSFPCLNDIALFVKKYNIDINYQDESGKTALMHLIDNKNKIIKISEELYNKTFEYLINNNNLLIEISDNKGISFFGFLLFNDYSIINILLFNNNRERVLIVLRDLIKIYLDNKFIDNRLEFNSQILIFIINYINFPKIALKILYYLLFAFRLVGIDLNCFNYLHQRSLFHYLCIYYPEDKTKSKIFNRLLSFLIKLKIDINIKDIFNRYAIFYLFIDEDNRIKNIDPFLKLEFFLKNFPEEKLNDVDIYGNSLIFYAVYARAYNCINLLLKYNVSLDIQNKCGNTIYSISLLLGDYNLFSFLYKIKSDNKIFSQKIYSSKQIESFFEEENNCLSLIKLYKAMNISFPKSLIFKEELEKISKKDYDRDYKKFKFMNKNQKDTDFKSNYLDLINDESNYFLELFAVKIMKIKEILNINDFNIYFTSPKYLSNIKTKFKKDFVNIINEINSEKKIILAPNLYNYAKLKNYQNFCQFMVNENYNLISLCNDLLSLNKKDELYYYINQILKKDLLNYKNEDNVTIFHILAKIDDSSFYEDPKITKHQISNLFDNLGNTPIYYACKILNKSFIEAFTKYSIKKVENKLNNVNYSLFIETRNDTNPLKSLYLHLNKKDIKIINLIIDLSINLKIVYINFIILFLIKEYNSLYKKYFSLQYEDNLNSKEYIRKIIGLYLFYTKQLNGNFTDIELKDMNPIFVSIYSKNFDLLNDVLFDEKNINKNCRNKEGKTIVHLIVEIKVDSKMNKIKKDILLKKALDAGCDYSKRDNKGKLPLDYAYLNNESSIIKILTDQYKGILNL